jgi:hypothetical protein
MVSKETKIENLDLITGKDFTQVKTELKGILEFLKSRMSKIDYTNRDLTEGIAAEFKAKVDTNLVWNVMSTNDKSTLRVLEYVSVGVQTLYKHIHDRITMNCNNDEYFDFLQDKNQLLVSYLEILTDKLEVDNENQINNFSLYMFENLYSFIYEVLSNKIIGNMCFTNI